MRRVERDRVAAELRRRGAVAAAAIVRGLADDQLLSAGEPALHLRGESCRLPGAHG